MGNAIIKCFKIEPYILNDVLEITIFKLVDSINVKLRKESITQQELSKIVEEKSLNCDYVHFERRKSGIVKAYGEHLISFKSNYIFFHKPTKLLRIGIIYSVTTLTKNSNLSDENILVTNLSSVEWFKVQNDIYVFEGFIKVKIPNVYGLVMETEDGVRIISLTNDKCKALTTTTIGKKKEKRKMKRKRKRKEKQVKQVKKKKSKKKRKKKAKRSKK